jgi:hypothetical protein
MIRDLILINKVSISHNFVWNALIRTYFLDIVIFHGGYTLNAAPIMPLSRISAVNASDTVAAAAITPDTEAPAFHSESISRTSDHHISAVFAAKMNLTASSSDNQDTSEGDNIGIQPKQTRKPRKASKRSGVVVVNKQNRRSTRINNIAD